MCVCVRVCTQSFFFYLCYCAWTFGQGLALRGGTADGRFVDGPVLEKLGGWCVDPDEMEWTLVFFFNCL